MGSGFNIAIQREGADLSVKLQGDINGISVKQLIECLEENGRGANVAVIETDELGSVDASWVSGEAGMGGCLSRKISTPLMSPRRAATP